MSIITCVLAADVKFLYMQYIPVDGMPVFCLYNCYGVQLSRQLIHEFPPMISYEALWTAISAHYLWKST